MSSLETQQRQNMIAQQIRSRGITSARVLAALERVPRERFVPPMERDWAYADGPLPIGCGQTISQPYVVALMTNALALTPESRVLEVGTGSGYQTAVLAELAQEVFTVEIHPTLHMRARTLLSEMGYTNVSHLLGDGAAGWPEHAPFDAIMVTAAPAEVPPALFRQLAEGGRLVIPVGIGVQMLRLITRHGDRFSDENLCPVRFVPLLRKEDDS